MSEKKWSQFLKNEIDKEMQEIDGILEEMNRNPETRDMKAPDELREKLFAQIHAEEEKERLTDEEQELIHLGMVYKRRQKWNKVLVLVAAVICAMAIGVTSMGGPKRVFEKVAWMIGDRQQTNIDTDDGRVQEQDEVTEAEAYAKIEDEFGFSPVELVYLPDGVKFESYILADGTQNICMCYAGIDEESIVYFIYPNYRTSSLGADVEDTLLDEANRVVQGNVIEIRKYFIEENQSVRYKVSYEHQNVSYALEINHVADDEVEKIVENLYFVD